MKIANQIGNKAPVSQSNETAQGQQPKVLGTNSSDSVQSGSDAASDNGIKAGISENVEQQPS